MRMGTLISGICVSVLQKENGLSCQHQTWYTYTLCIGPRPALHWPKGQQVSVGPRHKAYEVCCRRGCAGRYDCLGFLRVSQAPFTYKPMQVNVISSHPW